MTTITAVYCKDAIVVTSDAQATKGYTKETTTKVKMIENSLFGGAGTSGYIDIFCRYVSMEYQRRSDSEDCFDSLDRATNEFCRYIGGIIPRWRPLSIPSQELLNRLYPQAIFATYDQTQKLFYIYELTPPDSPQRLIDAGRITIGSGASFATMLFTQIERVLKKRGFDWRMLSATLVSQICHILLGRVIEYDLYTGGSPITHRITADGCKKLSIKEVFPQEKKGTTQLIETAYEELGHDNVKELIKLYAGSDFIQRAIKSEFGGF